MIFPTFTNAERADYSHSHLSYFIYFHHLSQNNTAYKYLRLSCYTDRIYSLLGHQCRIFSDPLQTTAFSTHESKRHWTLQFTVQQYLPGLGKQLHAN